MAKKNSDYGEDFQFLVRINQTDLDGKKTVANGLTGIKGINNRLSRIVATQAGVDRRKILGECNAEEVKALTAAIDSIGEYTPVWMRNRQHDPESGDDMHITGTEIQLTLREDLNRLKKIRSWRGLRHERNLPVRGQRTKANGRTGATVGVQRKK